MGCVANIRHDHFPEQGPWLSGKCEVTFHYSPHEFPATCVRDDREAPRLTIFRLDDGRHVLSTECQHTLPRGV